MAVSPVRLPPGCRRAHPQLFLGIRPPFWHLAQSPRESLSTKRVSSQFLPRVPPPGGWRRYGPFVRGCHWRSSVAADSSFAVRLLSLDSSDVRRLPPATTGHNLRRRTSDDGRFSTIWRTTVVGQNMFCTYCLTIGSTLADPGPI